MNYNHQKFKWEVRHFLKHSLTFNHVCFTVPTSQSEVLFIFNSSIGIWTSSRDFEIAGQKLSTSGTWSNPSVLAPAWKSLLNSLLERNPKFFDTFIITGTRDFLIVEAPRMLLTDLDSWSMLLESSVSVQEAL